MSERMSPDIARLVYRLGREYWSAILGSQSKAVRERYERASAPAVGDFVIELSTRAAGGDPSESMGRLVRIVEAANGNEFDREYHVDTVNGREVSWSNATFVAIPVEKIG